MAGRMGHERVTVANLTVVEVTDDGVLIKGLVPGPVNNLIMITKVGEAKKFVPLWKEKVEGEEVAEPIVEAQTEGAGSQTQSAGDAQQASGESPSSDAASLSVSGQPESEEKPAEAVESASSSPADGQPAVSSETEVEVAGQTFPVATEEVEKKEEVTSSDTKVMEDKKNAS